MAHLELQVGDDRDEVRVAGALADAVHRALDLRRAGLDRDERVGDAAAGVVVAVDAERHATANASRDGGDRRGDLPGQRARRSCRRGRPCSAPASAAARRQSQRVVGVVAPAVEEVLGVVERRACPAPTRKATDSAIIARFSSRSTRTTFSRCRRPGLADDRARPARSTRRAPAGPRRRRPRRRAGASCRSAAISRAASVSPASSSKSSSSLGFDDGKPASMRWTPSSSSVRDDAHLLRRR